MSIVHEMRHWIGWAPGEVESTRSGGVVWVGYRCAICGRVARKEPTDEIPFLTDPTPPDEAFRP